MFQSTKARACIGGIIGWENHYNLDDIPALTASLNASESGEFYGEIHPAMRLDIIQSTLQEGRDLSAYLQGKIDSGVTSLLNDVYIEKELTKNSKEILQSEVIYNSEGFDTITNESRFVGIRFRPRHVQGLKATINRLALQLTEAQEGLTIYVYHSHRAKFVKKITYVSTVGNQFNWVNEGVDFEADGEVISGGSYYIGYYQDDLVGEAYQYEKLNWETGFCGTCDGGVNQTRYAKISRYVDMASFYVPVGGLPLDHDDIFVVDDLIETETNNWGFNFNMTVKCDLTNFWCDNRLVFRTALGLKVVMSILEDMKFTTEINAIEEQMKILIVRDLEGDKETRYINIPQRYAKALRAIKFDQSAINSVCLPEAIKSGVNYGFH